MSLSSKYNVELLAPAGSVEAFFGAIEAGADAIYCGLKDFSARAKAKNFTITEMQNLSAYAHSCNRKIYIPLNTLIKEAELPKLIDVLEGVAHCHVDGLIIQDLGVYHLVHTFFPEIPLHASTQMAVHNSAGVQMLEKMGFERAVLARELTLAEIGLIRKETSIELEHFIHGALCYSVSGHCFFSSFQTGNSGNRGGCAQPCRRKYSQNKQEKFTFSTSDFSTLALLPKLAQNGVMSFKIEGRMKNSEYVWNVVRAYREVLDCQETDVQAAIRQGEAILKQSHGRQTTSGFLTGKRASILLPHQKGGIGISAGIVEQVRGKYISFKSKTGLHIGDKLRIQPKTDQPGTAFTIRQIERGKRKIKQAQQGQLIAIQTPFFDRFNSGDHIFKISTGRGFTLSEETCRRRLRTATITPTPVQLAIVCTETVFTVKTTSPIPFTCTYDIESFPAKKSPLSLATLENIFKKTVHPELQLAKITTNTLPPIVIKPSRLKSIRRDFYEKLCIKISDSTQDKSQKRLKKIKLATPKRPILAQQQKPQFYILCDTPYCELNTPDITLILPVETTVDHVDYNYIWDIPSMIYGNDLQTTALQIREKIAAGYTHFRLNNIGHFTLFNQSEKVQLIAGPTLYCLNHASYKTLAQQQITFITTSFEDDKNNLERLCQSTLNIIQPVYGHIPLMTSRIPLQSTATIKTPTGEKLTTHQYGDLLEIHPKTPFSLSGRLHELQALNIYNYLIDLRGCTLTQQQNIFQKIRQDEAIPDSTFFNFDRGLQ